MTVLSSLQNPRVLAARKLRRRAHRERSGAFLAEGPRVVLEALQADAPIIDLFVIEGSDASTVAEQASSRGVPVRWVSPTVLEAIATTTTPQGVVAVIAERRMHPSEITITSGVVLVLAGVRDPGNAGTLIRSAAAAAADGVVFAPGGIDPYHPKTVRASAGTIFRIPVARAATLGQGLQALRANGVRVLAADARTGTLLHNTDLTPPLAFVLGNEAAGVPDEAAEFVDGAVSIEMVGPAESLNVGVAGSLLLFETVRRRSQQDRGRSGALDKYPHSTDV